MIGVSDGLEKRELAAETLGELLAYLESPKERILIEESILKLKEGRFFLALLGHFKRGKSTLANALLGEYVLPIGSVPVTSAIVRVEFGEAPKGIVEFRNGGTKEIPLRELNEYASEDSNPNNIKGVMQIVVRHPASCLRNGLVLVDTPGIGSIYIDGAASTYQFMERTDAAIFVASADPPVGHDELQLLRLVRRYASKVFFVINKTDYLAGEELARTLDYTSSVMKQALGGEEVRTYALSAKLALEGKVKGDAGLVERSGFSHFEKDVMSLVEGKGLLLVKSAADRALRAISNEEMALQLRKKSLQLNGEALRAKVAWLKSLQTNLEDRLALLDGEVSVRLKEILAKLDQDLDDFVTLEGPSVAEFVESFMLQEEMKGTSPRQLDALAVEALKKRLDEICAKFLESEDAKVRRLFGEMAKHISSDVGGIISDSRAKIGREFDARLDPARFEVEAPLMGSYRIAVDPLFGVDQILLSELPKLLPSPLLRRKVQNQIRKKAQEELERNRGRIRYHFVSRLEEASRQLKATARDALSSFIESNRLVIEQMQSAAYADEALRDSRLLEMERKLKGLGAIRARLDELVLQGVHRAS